ncbi:hypothetical protein RYX36_003250 [Vicia faba]
MFAGELNTSDDSILVCSPTSMNNIDVKGKVVLCELGGLVARVDKVQAVKDVDGGPMVLMNSKNHTFNPIYDVCVLPAVDYLNVLSSSQRNCSVVEKLSPDWSPASIIPAIMTIANKVNLHEKFILDQRLLPTDVFATGVGHVNPLKANDLGLVYDIETNDYIPYLCGNNASPSQITFNEVKQKVTYFVGFIPEDNENKGDNMIAKGSIKWVSGKYSVSIPISVVFV